MGTLSPAKEKHMIVTITKTIDSATLPDEFHTIVYSFSDNRKSWRGPLNGFISYADVSALSTALEPFFENKLEPFVEAARTLPGGVDEIHRCGDARCVRCHRNR